MGKNNRLSGVGHSILQRNILRKVSYNNKNYFIYLEKGSLLKNYFFK